MTSISAGTTYGPHRRLPTRLLLRNCFPQYLPGLAVDERQAQRVGALAESAHEACALVRGVGLGPGVAIDEPAGEGAVDENGELAGGGGQGFGFADADGQPAVEGPEGGLAPGQTHSGDAEHAGGAVGRGLGFAAEPAAAGDPVLGREGEPGSEVVFGGPARGVGADLGDELEGAIGGEAIDLCEVNPGQVVKDGPDVDVRFIAAPAGDAGAREGRRRGRDRGGQGLKLALDGGIAGEELRLTHVKEFEILRQDEDVLVAVVARQRGGDLVDRGLAVRVAVVGEDVGVALAGDEGPEDRQAGRADDVADDAREQEVHLGERLLHPLDIGAGGLDEDVTVAHEGAEGQDRPGGAEAAAQEPDTVEFAQPLTVLDIALAAGDVLDVAGVDEQDLEAARFEDVEDRDPVDAGRFHGDARHATGDEPVGEAVEVGGEGPERLDRGRISIGGNGHIVLGGAAVDAGDIDLDAVEHGGGATRRVGRPAAIVLHGMLLHTARGIRDQGGGVESILLNGITRGGVSPVTKPRLPGPRYDAGLRVAPVGRSASGPGCSADSRHAPPTARPARQFLA